jgi:arsenate reductase (glutaredoxin)
MRMFLLSRLNPVTGTSMNKKLTVYQKPTCSKCRTTLGLLKERGVEFEAINYFNTPLTEAKLRLLLKLLAMTPREILRKDEPVARQLGIGKKDFSDEELIALMAKHPDLIQRPIIVRGEQAVLGRPPENVEKLL